MPAILTAILPVLVQLLEELPSLAGDVASAWSLLTSNTAATAEQQAQIDAALDAAHQALQAS